MPDREMTPAEAIIILDRLNTDGRIEVDRDELRAAVRVAKAATNKQIQALPKSIRYSNGSGVVECPICGESEGVCNWEPNYCPNCGQALDWGEI